MSCSTVQCCGIKNSFHLISIGLNHSLSASHRGSKNCSIADGGDTASGLEWKGGKRGCVERREWRTCNQFPRKPPWWYEFLLFRLYQLLSIEEALAKNHLVPQKSCHRVNWKFRKLYNARIMLNKCVITPMKRAWKCFRRRCETEQLVGRTSAWHSGGPPHFDFAMLHVWGWSVAPSIKDSQG